MKAEKILLATILIFIFGTGFMLLTCGWLFNWVYLLEPNIWLTAEEIMSTNNMIWSNIVGFARALIFASVYAWVYKGLPGKGILKGLNYGFIVWAVGAATGMASMPFYMTINPVVVMYWIIQALIANLVYGAIVASVIKNK